MSKQELFDNLYKLIRLLKPEFYNKITWAVVVAGLALLSTSFIDKLVNALFKISFEIDITDGNDAVFGVVLVIIGLLYHAISRKIEIQENNSFKKEHEKKKIEHDIDVFNRTNKILDETILKEMLEWIGADHCFESDQKAIINNYFQEIQEKKNTYLYQDIEDSKKKLIIQIGNLKNFLSLNFFVFPNNQNPARRFCLYPELNIDRSLDPTPEESIRYDKKAEEMNLIIDEVYEKHEHYRLTIKRVLFI